MVMGKRIVPVIAAVFLAVGGVYINKECSCGVEKVPLLVLSGLFGCSETKSSGEKEVEIPIKDPADRNAGLRAGESIKPALSEKKEIIVTFIELGSVNCIPCRMMQPVMRAIEGQYGDQVCVVFHDVWTQDGAPQARRYGIRVIPTQVFLDKNGREYFRHEGFFPKEEVIKALKRGGVR